MEGERLGRMAWAEAESTLIDVYGDGIRGEVSTDTPLGGWACFT